MAGITGMGDSFSLPNYVGELFALTPSDTPLLSAIGGLTGGGMTSSFEAEWQTYDLRDPSQRGALEGATAPTSEERVRANVRNVCQIHHEKVSASYSKQAATGQLATPGSAPFRGVGGTNPVTNELDWQTLQSLKTVALDVNWSFINGLYNNPTTNAGKRKTRGLQQAIVTNVVDKSTVSYTAASSATDTITITHALANGDKVVFTNTGDATNIVAGRVYFVVNVSTTVSFKVAKTSGGTALTLGTSSANIDVHKPQTAALTVPNITALVQGVYDNGGLSGVPVFHVNSSQKTAITAAYAAAYGQSRLIVPGERIAGVAVDTVLTDFGTFGIMLDRHAPQDAITVLSLEQLRPFFLNTPNKGVFFEEPLAKTGSSDEVQIYGEIGLEYGNEKAHGVLRGLAV